jgi:hypothetical protein
MDVSLPSQLTVKRPPSENEPFGIAVACRFRFSDVPDSEHRSVHAPVGRATDPMVAAMSGSCDWANLLNFQVDIHDGTEAPKVLCG